MDILLIFILIAAFGLLSQVGGTDSRGTAPSGRVSPAW